MARREHGPLLADFEGCWRLERVIRDRRAGRTGRLSGTARFSAVEAGLEYEEQGSLVFPDAPPMIATRRYFWRQGSGEIAVFFEDGRPFHSFDPTGGTTDAHHFCDPDSYDVRYDFAAWPVWTSRWSVNGPRKDYLIESRFSPG